ncbi:MAG: type VI secretion system contractile sheath small subunit [Planctomycetota bacterium]|nr:type VI secretion system contractile sheath small subunit [Planctomycetota bacterium]
MAKDDGSVAPRERVNIRYKSATGNAQEQRELPLKMLFVGDYTLRQDDTPLAERKAINVNKDNFSKVMEGQKLKLAFGVSNKLEDAKGGEAPGDLGVNLKFDSLADFKPEAVAKQVPELNKLLELRQALVSLKSPLGNNKDFQKKIKDIVENEDTRKKILGELGADGKQG